jgi:hypothetical protein
MPGSKTESYITAYEYNNNLQRCLFKKNLFLLLQAHIITTDSFNIIQDEKDISAFPEKKKEQARFQRKNGFRKWSQSIGCQKSKR